MTGNISKRRSFSLQWHITAECDQNCAHCYVTDDRTYQQELENPLTLDGCTKVIDSHIKFAGKLGATPNLVLTGGDPLLRIEIFHLAYWDFFEETYGIKVDDLFDELYKSHTNSEQFNFWQISELLPEYYLKLPVFAKFKWNLFDRETGYPWMKKMKVIADPLWKRKPSFSTFIVSLHEKCGCPLRLIKFK
ncbi:hypothetical protein HZC30_01490 [Candidatus Woesearchaeota archaeon]|nr:hypothetical protein [Candidatus Woesearchaeota archaeon]